MDCLFLLLGKHRSMHIRVRDDQDMRENRPQQPQADGQVAQRFDQGQRHGADVEGDKNGLVEKTGSSAEEKTANETQLARCFAVGVRGGYIDGCLHSAAAK